MLKSIFYNKTAIRILKCQGKTIKKKIKCACFLLCQADHILKQQQTSVSLCMNTLLYLGKKSRRFNASQKFWLLSSVQTAAQYLASITLLEILSFQICLFEMLVLATQKLCRRKLSTLQQAFEKHTQHFLMHLIKASRQDKHFHLISAYSIQAPYKRNLSIGKADFSSAGWPLLNINAMQEAWFHTAQTYIKRNKEKRKSRTLYPVNEAMAGPT